MEGLQRGRGNLLEVMGMLMMVISRMYTRVKIVHSKHA